jgi:phage regulator Rha-like protein
MMPEHLSEVDFMACVDAIRTQDQGLSPLTAGVVAAVSKGIAADSRSFAKLFGIAHALVLREINQLAGPDAPIEIIRRDARTQRTHLKLTVKGEALCRLIP